MLSAGLATFVLNMLAGAWIKYQPYTSVSIASNVVIGLALIYLFYAHSRWAPYLVGDRSKHDKAHAVSFACSFSGPFLTILDF